MSAPASAADVVRQVHAAYEERTPASRAWHERASRSLLGGVSGTVRYFDPYPTYFSTGSGAVVTDIDGFDHIDCFLSGATLLLGHRDPEIMRAIADAAELGSIVLNPTRVTETAEQLQRLVPSAERVRFVNSGTEGIINAIRFARAFTGRPKLAKFSGTYHGMDDQVLVGLDHRNIRLGGGIPESSVADTVNCDFDDLSTLEAALAVGDVAAVLVDPSMHHGGLWVGTGDHYRTIVDLAHRAGALVIADEVISGFRLAPGGGQAYFGFEPDLSVFAKALAAGDKLGAIAGRADVMAVADSSRHRSGPFAFQSGTGSDATVGQVSALVAMRRYAELGEAGAYADLSARADRLGAGITAAFADHGLPCRHNQLGPIVRLFPTDAPVDHAAAERLPRRVVDTFHLALLTEGVLTLPGSNDFFLSFAHDDHHIDLVIDAAHRVLDRFDLRPLFDV